MDRFKEPSTWAGLALLFQGIAQAVASKGADPAGWTAIMGGIAATVMKEAGRK